MDPGGSSGPSRGNNSQHLPGRAWWGVLDGHQNGWVVISVSSAGAVLLRKRAGALEFIHQAKLSHEQHHVLVNCAQGVSRSASVTIAYLIQPFGPVVSDVLIKSARDWVYWFGFSWDLGFSLVGR